MRVLIKSSAKEKRIAIFEHKNSNWKLVAQIMDDLILEGPSQLPVKVSIRNPKGKVIGYLETFHPQKDEIQVQNVKGSIISRLEKGKGFVEKKGRWLRGLKKHLFKIIARDQLLFEKEIGAAIKCSYRFDKVEVYYFEKGDEIEGIIKGRGGFLEYLPLILQKRIWDQEMVKTLLAKKS